MAAAPASRARSFSDADLHRRVSPRLPRKGPGAIVASPVVPLEGNLSASSSPLRSSSTDPTAIRRDGTTVGATVAPEAGTPEPQSPLVSVAGPAQPRALVGDNKRHVAVPSQLASASTSVSTGLAIAPAAPRAVSPDSDPDGVCVWYQLENSMTGQAVGDVDCVIVDGMLHAVEGVLHAVEYGLVYTGKNHTVLDWNFCSHETIVVPIRNCQWEIPSIDIIFHLRSLIHNVLLATLAPPNLPLPH